MRFEFSFLFGLLACASASSVTVFDNNSCAGSGDFTTVTNSKCQDLPEHQTFKNTLDSGVKISFYTQPGCKGDAFTPPQGCWGDPSQGTYVSFQAV